jgi:hypothetical protein
MLNSEVFRPERRATLAHHHHHHHQAKVTYEEAPYAHRWSLLLESTENRCVQTTTPVLVISLTLYPTNRSSIRGDLALLFLTLATAQGRKRNGIEDQLVYLLPNWHYHQRLHERTQSQKWLALLDQCESSSVSMSTSALAHKLNRTTTNGKFAHCNSANRLVLLAGHHDKRRHHKVLRGY